MAAKSHGRILRNRPVIQACVSQGSAVKVSGAHYYDISMIWRFRGGSLWTSIELGYALFSVRQALHIRASGASLTCVSITRAAAPKGDGVVAVRPSEREQPHMRPRLLGYSF